MITLLQAEIEYLNKQRKSDQLSTGTQLRALTSKWEELVQKNIEIQIATHYLEVHLAELKQMYPNVQVPAANGDGQPEVQKGS